MWGKRARALGKGRIVIVMSSNHITPESILDFLKSSPAPQTKREIARAFGIKGGENRVALKQILKKLEAEEAIVKQGGGTYGVPDGLPSVGIIVVHEVTIDGEMFAIPANWNAEIQGEAPRIEILADRKGFAALTEGDRVLARLMRQSGNDYDAKIIRRLDENKGAGKGTVLGLVRSGKRDWILQPADKKAKYDYFIPQADLNGAQDGDLAVGEIQPARGMKNKNVRITKILGRREDPKAISLISLHEAGLNSDFPDDVMKAAEGLKVPPIKGREDLRSIPLVTIDGADARDFDDAVFAEKVTLDNGYEGYHLIVAIADVSHYVRPGSVIDKEAYTRGNSTYFPDRVVPMLPEGLSNDLCSLRPHEDRACMAVHMWVDDRGQLVKYKFVRGLMKSHARLIYEQVQAARDGQQDDITRHLMDDVINPLYEVYDVLDAARQRRGALDLDLPERQILIDEGGNMTGVRKRLRMDSHKLIEEFMVLANVAAASALEDKRAPCVYRVHDKPNSDKIDSAREFVQSFELSLPKGQAVSPGQLNKVLKKAADLPYSHLISMVILRCQSQAVYATENIGHYGLSLAKYGHFTSPIRRYADLLVHRALVNAYHLGGGGMSEGEEARLDELCGHISDTERNSMMAERSSIDRFTASYLSEQIGAEFDGKISGVSKFGLFVELSESGADGLIPMRTLPDDYYIHDEELHALIGRKKKRVYRLGAPVTVRLKEADGFTGSCLLELVGASLNGAEIEGFTLPRRRNMPDRGGRPDKRNGNRGGGGGGHSHKRGGKKPGTSRFRGKTNKR